MHGDVWEWVSNPYDNYPRGGMNDAMFDATASKPVIRRGGCIYSAGSFRSTVRQGLDPSIRDDGLGFRAWTALDEADP